MSRPTLATALLLGACGREPPYGGALGADTGDGEAVVDPAFTLGPVLDCPAPAAAVSYEEVGAAWGLRGPLAEAPDHLDDGGVGLADLDGDGVLDLVQAFVGEPPRVLWGDGQGFTEAPLLEHPVQGQLRVLDLDLDGDLDVVGGGATPWVTWNEGERRFEAALLEGLLDHDSEVVRELVALDVGRESEGAAGRGTDLLAVLTSADGAEFRQDRLARQVAPGVFETELLDPTLSLGEAFDALPFDWDGDGDLDVYVVNDFGTRDFPNVLWEQRDGALVSANAACTCDVAQEGMGGSVGDVDGDGLADLYLAATGWCVLLQGQPDGSFVDVTQVTRADPLTTGEPDGLAFDMAWGSLLLDQDNDGDTDILVARGDLWAGEEDELPAFEAPLSLLRQAGGVFEEVGPDLGLAQEGSHRALLAADLNADGVLDLLATDVAAAPRLYLSEGCTTAGWLAVWAPAHSRVEVTAGGRTQVAWTNPDPGYAASVSPLAWLGLGEAQVVDRLVLTTLSGSEYVIEGPLPARRHVFLDGGGPGAPVVQAGP